MGREKQKRTQASTDAERVFAKSPWDIRTWKSGETSKTTTIEEAFYPGYKEWAAKQPPMPPPPPTFVYFIRDGRRGPIKIGYTRKVYERLRGLSSQAGRTMQLLAVMPGGKVEERALHRQFAAVRGIGEWFEPAAELVKVIRDTARKHRSLLLDGRRPTKTKKKTATATAATRGAAS
jgi:hypothetical protein